MDRSWEQSGTGWFCLRTKAKRGWRPSWRPWWLQVASPIPICPLWCSAIWRPWSKFKISDEGVCYLSPIKKRDAGDKTMVTSPVSTLVSCWSPQAFATPPLKTRRASWVFTMWCCWCSPWSFSNLTGSACPCYSYISCRLSLVNFVVFLLFYLLLNCSS